MALELSPLPPKEAIAYFRSKGLQEGFAWQDVTAQEHARAFTVAKMMSRELLEDTRGLIDRAIAEGTTFEQFRDALKPKLQAAGWWGRQKMVDPGPGPDTGKEKLVQLGSDRRLRTIYDTNLRVAYRVGAWRRAWASRALLPFLMYRHNSVRFPRPEHQAWDRQVLPIDDPWWDTHYPPCEWGCRCDTISLSQRMMDARGLKVTRPVAHPPKVHVNPRTGEVIKLERGIGPGWNHNVGKHPWRALTARPAPPPLGVPKGPPADRRAAVEAFLKVTGTEGKPRVITDREGFPVVVGRDLFTDAAGGASVPRPDLVAALPDVGRVLVNPDRVEWLWSDDNRAMAPHLAERLDAVLEGREDKAYLSRVAPWLAEAVRPAGVQVDDFAHTLAASEARHILNRHGDPIVEASRDQIAVTLADLRALPAIVARPDVVVTGLVDDRNVETIGFVQVRNRDVVVYLANVRRGRRELAAKTMRIMTAGADVLDIAQGLDLTPENGGGTKGKVLDLRGKIKAARAQLVRRYTGRVDKREITVDFYPDRWTYDVQDLAN